MEIETLLPPFCSFVLLISVLLTWCCTRSSQPEQDTIKEDQETEMTPIKNEIADSELDNKQKED